MIIKGDFVTAILWNTYSPNQIIDDQIVIDAKKAICQSGIMCKLRTRKGQFVWIDSDWLELVKEGEA